MDEIIVEDLPDKNEQHSAKKHEITDSVEHLALASRFNIESPTSEEASKLMEIWNYGKSQSETKDITDVIWRVISLENTLGAPMLGESRLDRIYRFAKLKRQESLIQEELKNVSTRGGL